jgi:ankyrin repeat protein
VARAPKELTARDGAAETPLHGAAWGGDVKEARDLVTAGADVNHVDTAGETPIHGAAAWGRTEMVAYLISAGARIDIPGTTGLTPLHWAAGWGNLETVKVLLEAGADPKALNDFGHTAAQVALEHRRSDVAAFLRAQDDA